ncbi:hypothetical protein B9Z65_1195 [Elsinoe australis]|uniref:Uncharacterized protein n=1 Tax=Elsinoe australis TaxID=40998 RepID=A0A2P7YPW7_9PEZI|nr:hypothetical protein B9Z65_1195 [Elsinoe australis]
MAVPQSVTAATVTASFMLVGNAITQSWMTIPVLVAGFPAPGTEAHAERCSLLGQQWGMMHKVGNSFFRPISMLAIFGYAFGAYSCAQGSMKGDWRLFTFAALCHVANVPINAKLDVIGTSEEKAPAVQLATSWINCNKWRVVFPLIAGSTAIWQAFLLGM